MFDENKTDEEKNKGADTSSTSGENSEDQNQDQNQGQKGTDEGQGEGTPDQLEELKKLRKENTEKDELLKKSDKEIKQQRFTLGKLDKKLSKAKEDGFVDDEPSGGVSEERIVEIAKEQNQPVLEAVEKLGNTISEMTRTQTSRNALSSGGGSGQKKPVPPKEPDLPTQARDTVKRLKLEWIGKGFIYKSPVTGRIYDLEDDSDIK